MNMRSVAFMSDSVEVSMETPAESDLAQIYRVNSTSSRRGCTDRSDECGGIRSRSSPDLRDAPTACGRDNARNRGNRARLSEPMRRATKARSCSWSWGSDPTRQISLEQLEDAAVFVCPRRRSHEGVVFDGINRKLPAGLAELDQSLGESNDILEMDICV